MKVKYILIFYSILFFGCKERNIILKQANNEYTKIEVDKFNQIKAIINYKNNILNGQIIYFNKGRLERIVQVDNNKLNGPGIYFYPSGFIDIYCTYKNDYLQNEAYDFRDSIIMKFKKFVFYHDGRIHYQETIDEQGNITKSEGNDPFKK